jgi:hypothetical protein
MRHVHCVTYPDRTPILTAWGDGTHVALRPVSSRTVTADELEFVRALITQVARYAAECERIARLDRGESLVIAPTVGAA